MRVWDWLRMTRSNLPGLAARDSDRAGLYQAALQQFEELMRAAESCGPASRPLPLFYALTQAGRAVVAVRGGPAHKTHGLTLEDPQQDPLDTVVRYSLQNAKMPGHFQAVAQAVKSPALNGPVEIGAL